MSHYPFKAEPYYYNYSDEVDPNKGPDFWWVVSSNEDDNMLTGDQNPKTQKAAEYAARCANIAYKLALEDLTKKCLYGL